MTDLTEKSHNKQTDSSEVKTTKNQYQILEIQSIEDENEKQNLIEMGIKCVTPGLPKEKLDEETKQQVKNVVDDQNGLIRERNKRTLKNIEEDVNDDEEDDEEDDDENEYDGEDDEDDQHSSGEESRQNEVNKENESENNDTPNSNKKGSKFYNIKSIHRMHAPSPLNLKRQPSIFNKRIKTATDQTPQSSNKSKIMIKYTGYNQNFQTTPQQMTPEFLQQMALYQQQQLAMYQQQMTLQRTQQQQQQQYIQANPQLYQQFYMNSMMMNPLNGTPIAYNQNMLQQFQGQQPLMNAKKEVNSVQKKKEKNGLTKNKGQAEGEKEDEKENEKEEIENNEKEGEEEEEEEEEIQADGNDQSVLNKIPESATENLHYEGIIRINHDNFQFEFETLKEQTVGKLPIQINELNKKKFLKICEKIWDESYWLMKKREQYSNPTPTGLNPVLDIQQRDEEEEEEKVIENNESEISSQKEASPKDQE